MQGLLQLRGYRESAGSVAWQEGDRAPRCRGSQTLTVRLDGLMEAQVPPPHKPQSRREGVQQGLALEAHLPFC